MEEEALAKFRDGEFGDSLDSIAQAARTENGRRILSSLGAVPLILSKFQVCVPDIASPLALKVLRALRNLCAGEARSQDAFVEEGGVKMVASLVGKYSAKFMRGESERAFTKVALQVMGNVAGGDEHARKAVWKWIFPEVAVDLACGTSTDVHEPLTMVLYTCCRGSEERRLRISQGIGARLLAHLLTDEDESNNEWLSLLLEDTCLKNEQFPLLFRSMGVAVDENAFTSDQAALLSKICSMMEERLEAGEEVSMPRNSMSVLVDIIHEAALKLSDISEKSTAWPTGSPTPDVLGFGLLLGKVLCSQENTPVDEMLPLLDICLQMLRRLGPPEMVKKASNATQERIDSDSGEHSRFPVHNVYRGYRRDLVAVIGNMSFRNFTVQERVRLSGGLLLVLQQCVVDEDNPFLREWSLWAVRNLTEGNEENIREIESLELKQAVNTEEILKAGFQVEVDPKTNKPKLCIGK